MVCQERERQSVDWRSPPLACRRLISPLAAAVILST
jgi:hypothetical protein